jgi:hypothetical protein
VVGVNWVVKVAVFDAVEELSPPLLLPENRLFIREPVDMANPPLRARERNGDETGLRR